MAPSYNLRYSTVLKIKIKKKRNVNTLVYEHTSKTTVNINIYGKSKTFSHFPEVGKIVFFSYFYNFSIKFNVCQVEFISKTSADSLGANFFGFFKQKYRGKKSISNWFIVYFGPKIITNIFKNSLSRINPTRAFDWYLNCLTW